MEERLTLSQLADKATTEISNGIKYAKTLDARSIIYRALQDARNKAFDDGIAYQQSKTAEEPFA